MKITLYGRQRLWFWIPFLIFWIFFIVASSIDLEFNLVCFSIQLIPIGWAIWRIIVICKQPDFSASDYYYYKSLQETFKDVILCPSCGKATSKTDNECRYCGAKLSLAKRIIGISNPDEIDGMLSTIQCPYCGKPTPGNKKKCKFCAEIINPEE